MNLKRYTFAALISISAHTAIVTLLNEQKAFAMPTGTNSSSVSINLVSAVKSQPLPSSHQSTTETATKQHKDNTDSPTEKNLPKATPPKKSEINPEKKPAYKEVAAKQRVATKPKQAKSQAQTRKTPIQQPKKNVTKPQQTEPNPQQQNSQATAAKQGVTQKPLMVEKPSFLSPPSKPRYPRLAQRKGIEGTATYEIWLDANGNQLKQSLISSSGADMLDKAALDAIKKWKFSPQKINGISIAHRVQVPIRFQLD
ncbi:MULTISPECIES: energy transducer TonB [Vibrio]|uniref:Energy transducer TonB n=1 Tax=Vibrio casei TaxID=673372 RepID=A0A368LHH6_9VIBR|nr:MULTISPECIES: energy transducer TonB [Vibrio]RCS70200.1 energy transducer TonB [Vibrio casei]SJN25703.1 Ferric siderophore transport system, periplasmic binding protein TonB [Vibrio casei]HBV76039.1 energy transducer TonB [Vibrio sp.]